MYRTHLVSALAAGLLATVAGSGASQERPGPAGPERPSAPDTSPLIHEADLNVAIEKVWWVFSTDEGFKYLGAAKAKIDFRPGGKMLSHYDPKGVLGDEGTIENTVLAYEPLHMVAWRITKPPKGFPYMEAYKTTWSVATMTDLGGGRTHLRLAGMGYTADPESQRMRAFFDQGNAWVLAKLKENLERTAGQAAAAPVAPLAPAGSTSAAEAGNHSSTPEAPIETEAIVAAPVAEVWQCWTTSEGIKSFLTDARVELEIGGTFEIYFNLQAPEGQRGSEGCKILSYDPGRMLSFSWNAPPQFGPLREKRTWVVVQVEPYGPHACKVRLRHMGFAEQAGADRAHEEQWAELRAYFSKAWPSVLGALRERFEPPAKS